MTDVESVKRKLTNALQSALKDEADGYEISELIDNLIEAKMEAALTGVRDDPR